jgi:predicted DNA-binding transcriptional regulator AlpA
MDQTKTDLPVTAKQAATLVGLAESAFWRAVAAGRLPAPVYPLPRAPRWIPSELHAAMQATRALPRDQMASRRATKLAAQAAA